MGRVENIVGKGENAGYQHFLLFPQCFQKVKSLDCVIKSQLGGKRINSTQRPLNLENFPSFKTGRRYKTNKQNPLIWPRISKQLFLSSGKV